MVRMTAAAGLAHQMTHFISWRSSGATYLRANAMSVAGIGPDRPMMAPGFGKMLPTLRWISPWRRSI